MESLEHTNYQYILSGLKEKIRLARQNTIITVNYEMLMLYWETGNTILQEQKQEGWGKKVISRLAKDLKAAFPDMKGLSERNLVYMQTFAGAWPHFPVAQVPLAQLHGSKKEKTIITQAPLAQITWYHHITLLDKIKDQQTRLFYLTKTIDNGWSRNVMLYQIESQLHLRQGSAITNFELTLPKSQSDLAREAIKNPYVFDFLGIGEDIQERELVVIESLPINTKTKLVITDLNSVARMTTVVNSNTYNLNISNLKQGNYMLQVIVDGKGIATKKFIKE